MQYIRGEPRDRWRAREQDQGRDQATWQAFPEFLLDLIQNPVNRQLNTAQKYADARQRTGQSVHAYVTYIEGLEEELPVYTEEQGGSISSLHSAQSCAGPKPTSRASLLRGQI